MRRVSATVRVVLIGVATVLAVVALFEQLWLVAAAAVLVVIGQLLELSVRARRLAQARADAPPHRF